MRPHAFSISSCTLSVRVYEGDKVQRLSYCALQGGKKMVGSASFGDHPNAVPNLTKRSGDRR